MSFSLPRLTMLIRREYVKTYVMSDAMTDSLQAPVIDQLQMDEVVDNKASLLLVTMVQVNPT